MTELSFTRFYELKQQYEGLRVFEAKKLTELTIQPLGFTRDTNEQKLVVDKLKVLDATAGRRAPEVYSLLEKELNECRDRILQGESTGDITEDMAVGLYGLHPKFDNILASTKGVVQYLQENKGKELVVVRHYERVVDEDSILFVPKLYDLERGAFNGTMSLRQNLIPTSRGELIKSRFEDDGMPDIVLALGGNFTTERLVSMAEGELQRGNCQRIGMINIDPRILPTGRHVDGKFIFQIRHLEKPLVDVSMGAGQTQNRTVVGSYLSAVEIVAGSEVRDALTHYLG